MASDSHSQQPECSSPLSDRMRPRTIDDFVGQDHLLGEGKLIRRMIEGTSLHSIILWGPPGTGKTTLAHIIAGSSGCRIVSLSAVTSGIKEVRQVIAEAAEYRRQENIRTILFIDEIHRFNKSQQDAFLPHVEHGDIILIGATTENPSFEVIAPLLSRTKVLMLNPLSEDSITTIIQRALSDTRFGLGLARIDLPDDVLRQISAYCQGDARVALNTLEIAAMIADRDAGGARRVTREIVEQAMQQKMLIYDKAGEEHYNLISALHKSLRSSDVQASIYWLARMLEAGEDPMYIARRLIRFASEDIGLADPRAIEVTVACRDACHCIGLPEGTLALAQAVVYLATAPKSNALYRAYSRAVDAVKRFGAVPVPLHIRNAPTTLMRDFGYGKNYKYDHDFENAISDQQCLPDNLKDFMLYEPGERGFEKTIRDRMEFVRKTKKKTDTQRRG